MFFVRKAHVAALAMTCSVGAAAFVGAPAGAKPRQPTPSTTIAPVSTTVPTSVVTPTSASVVIVPANSQPYQFESSFYVQVSPNTQLGDAELLSGPTLGGPAIVLVSDFGRVSFLRLVPNADYVFRYRNKIWIASSASFISSPWVQFSFRAPTLP